MEANPLSCKQTCEDLNAYNPPTTPATKQDQSSKYELQHLIKNLEDENSTLEKSNHELFNDSINNIKSNSELMKSIDRKLKRINNKVNTLDSAEQYLKDLKDKNTQLSNELSTLTKEMNDLYFSNNEYVNENKIIKNQIQKLREKVRKTNNFCDDLCSDNKE